MVETAGSSSDRLLSAMDQVEASGREALKSQGQETDLADLVTLLALTLVTSLPRLATVDFLS